MSISKPREDQWAEQPQSIWACPRCSHDHTAEFDAGLRFNRLARPAGEWGQWTHYATCPVTGEPLLAGWQGTVDFDVRVRGKKLVLL